MLPVPTVEVRGRAGRYLIFDELASGGMAAVHLGRLLGSAGFVRTVAIKRIHPHFARDPDFVAMFTDEARLAARIRHPNVVSTLDFVTAERELFLVMEYIHGESLSKLLRATSLRKEVVPIPVAVGICIGILHGLHAAHEATTEAGAPLGLVHRDVSPQNVMVGQDGIARVVDFGVAKAAGRLQTTRDGKVKGKSGYVAPEQLRGRGVDRRADVYAAAVVLWETLTGHRLFVADSSAEVMRQVLTAEVAPPSAYRDGISPALDALVLRGLCRDPEARFATSLELALALEGVIAQPSPRDIGQWLESAAGEVLDARAALVAAIERHDVSDLRIAPLPVAIEPSRWLAPVAPVAIATDGVTVRMVQRPRRRGRLAVALLAATTVVAVLAGVALTRRRPVASAVASVGRVVSVPSEPAVTGVPSASVEATPPSHEPPPRIVPVKPARRAPARKATPQCAPPYTVDADGIHIPKAECE